MYQEFTEDQLTELSSFVETPAYAELKTLPPWQRAYGLSVHLGQSETETAFNLLLNAMWRETDSFFASPQALDQLLRESEFELRRAPEDVRPILNAILAYALAYAGRPAESAERLKLAREAPDTSEYLRQYISAVEACQSNMETPDCRPNSAFRP